MTDCARPRRFRFVAPDGAPWCGVVWPDGSATVCQAQQGSVWHVRSLAGLARAAGVTGDAIEWLDPYQPNAQIVPPGVPQVVGHVLREQATRAAADIAHMLDPDLRNQFDAQEIIEEHMRAAQEALLRTQGVLP